MTMAQLGSALRDLACEGVVYLDRRADAVLVQTSTTEWTGGHAEMSPLDPTGQLGSVCRWRVEWLTDPAKTDGQEG